MLFTLPHVTPRFYLDISWSLFHRELQGKVHYFFCSWKLFKSHMLVCLQTTHCTQQNTTAKAMGNKAGTGGDWKINNIRGVQIRSTRAESMLEFPAFQIRHLNTINLNGIYLHSQWPSLKAKCIRSSYIFCDIPHLNLRFHKPSGLSTASKGRMTSKSRKSLITGVTRFCDGLLEFPECTGIWGHHKKG